MEWRWSWVGVEMELGVDLELGKKQKWLRMIPLTHPAKKIDQVDSKIKVMG